MNSLGERIASLRKAKGMTQEQLAELCSVTPQAVSKWENNITAPDILLIPRLSELLCVSCDELLGVRRADTVMVHKDTVDLNKMLLKIRILSNDGDKVNVNFPLAIAELFIKNKDLISLVSGNKNGKNLDALKEIDFDSILSLVHQGVIGKIIEIEDKEGTKVEVWVE